MKPLTKTQREALSFIASQPRGETSGYGLKVNRCGNTATLQQLSARGLVTPVGLGHLAFPANGTWRLTAKGLEVLDQFDAPA